MSYLHDIGAAIDLLSGHGDILDVARELTTLCARAGIEAAVVGGVAVVLHGHVRTTRDVDLLVAGPLEQLRSLLSDHGFECDPTRREFRKHNVPVHLVVQDQTRYLPRAFEDHDGIRTPSLADLINMKLRSGTSNLLRAQDLADVIGLIRVRGLTPAFAAQIDADLRPEFRKLAEAVQREG